MIIFEFKEFINKIIYNILKYLLKFNIGGVFGSLMGTPILNPP
jgi:hypothetical protein